MSNKPALASYMDSTEYCIAKFKQQHGHHMSIAKLYRHIATASGHHWHVNSASKLIFECFMVTICVTLI